MRKVLWSPDEDERLVRCITKYVHGSWTDIARKAGLDRCGKSCRRRWLNHLRPDLKHGKFSLDEINLIVELHDVLGNRWSDIASHLEGRTDNDVKNLWNTQIKRRRLAQQIKTSTFSSLPSTFGETNETTTITNAMKIDVAKNMVESDTTMMKNVDCTMESSNVAEYGDDDDLLPTVGGSFCEALYNQESMSLLFSKPKHAVSLQPMHENSIHINSGNHPDNGMHSVCMKEVTLDELICTQKGALVYDVPLMLTRACREDSSSCVNSSMGAKMTHDLVQQRPDSTSINATTISMPDQSTVLNDQQNLNSAGLMQSYANIPLQSSATNQISSLADYTLERKFTCSPRSSSGSHTTHDEVLARRVSLAAQDTAFMPSESDVYVDIMAASLGNFDDIRPPQRAVNSIEEWDKNMLGFTDWWKLLLLN
ncbi:hypothetical protein GOP47_0002710 [Adiantum capillus-veneris]|uniref:Uncharacterized protein n=1 Tax=Adiantum capillus-veneris TaxID=13818 RepID=A0A9D4VB58_ADICA|nr:hypothetical protein GOP47_0002710 [Adiantum capillus-veneris]